MAAVVLALVLGLSTAGLFAPASAGAEGPAALYFGFVVADPDGTLPLRVRAMGAGGIICGTADVQQSGEDVGFYTLSVASSASKDGCPIEGTSVTFILLYGQVDDGVPAHPSALFRAGEVSVVHLARSSDSPPSLAGWQGTPPPPGGVALLVWDGPDETPVEQAALTLGVPVARIWWRDAEAGKWRLYAPGGPLFVQTYTTVHTGDVVVVRAQ